jgi:hypothetical protein
VKPEQLALLGYVNIPFDILKMIDSGNGVQARLLAIDSLKHLNEKYTIRKLIKKIDLFNIENV